jgi:hypothetical protein
MEILGTYTQPRHPEYGGQWGCNPNHDGEKIRQATKITQPFSHQCIGSQSKDLACSEQLEGP